MADSTATAIKEREEIASMPDRSIFKGLSLGSMEGAIAGLLCGVIYGYANEKNLYVSAFTGLVIGGAISYIMIGGLAKKQVQE